MPLNFKEPMKYFITGTRRGLGKKLEDHFGNCGSLEECDIFINNKHDGFEQVEMLYRATEMGKRVINIGSRAAYSVYSAGEYSIQKKALRDANNQLFTLGKKTTCINFGWLDTERSADVDEEKIDVEYCVELIEWILLNDHKILEITVCA